MKNHFIYSYVGNKRDEVEQIYKALEDEDTLKDVTHIIEPFAGSCAMSVYLSMIHPQKFKYILNDNDILLTELYKIFQDNEKIKEFVNNINSLCFVDDKFISKERYNQILRENTLYSYYIKHKYYNIRAGLYPMRLPTKKLNYDDIVKIPFVKFLQTENIEIYNLDALEIVNLYNKKEMFIFLDPPYLAACNHFYDKTNINIYEWFFYNKKILLNACFVLENVWIIKLLFQDIKLIEYDKLYQMSKKKTTHIIALIN